MKTRLFFLFTLIFSIFIFESFNRSGDEVKDDQYLVIGWNDLGMHFANKDFSKVVVLPPYNNLMAQIIKLGSESTSPEVMTNGFSITYEIPGNTYSVGKTNFWDYEYDLFGVELPDNIGLTGAGLSGEMESTENYFSIEGVPLTPFTDANLIDEDPYQLALLNAYDDQNALLAFTQPVIPVSNEINCVSSGCHSSENNILYEHEEEGGFDPTDTPILCAECHSSNALGTPGTPGLESLSQVIHEKHGDETNDCYKCHPGPNTQCHRGIMNQLGMVCQDCHGSVQNVGQSINNGREPWLEEPSCGATECHGSNYAEEPGLLFRQSKGHGGLFCSACHGSPHAIYPGNERDNVQNMALQGFAGILSKCSVCHGVNPSGPGPHGIFATDIRELNETNPLIPGQFANPNPAKGDIFVTVRLDAPSKVVLDVYSLKGDKMVTLINKRLYQGAYSIEVGTEILPDGLYLLILTTAQGSYQQKLLISR